MVVTKTAMKRVMNILTLICVASDTPYLPYCCPLAPAPVVVNVKRPYRA
jgi:hypothetical protein